MNKDEIKEKLQAGVCMVKFTKADGTERTMVCTLEPSFLPRRNLTEDWVPPQEPDTSAALKVWDIDKDDWRSFRVDSVFSVETISAES